MQKLIIHCTCESELQPEYSTVNASGADLKAQINDTVVINPGERSLIPTGLRIQIPEGYEAQVRPRSGLAVKSGITVLNSPGTIDSDYRGEIKVLIINFGTDPFKIDRGDRIAQLVFTPIIQAEFIKKDYLNSSNRGSGGFGSTGVS